MSFMGMQSGNTFGQTSTFGSSQPSKLLTLGNTTSNLFNTQPTNGFSTFGTTPNLTQNPQNLLFNTGSNNNQNGGLFGNTANPQPNMFPTQPQQNTSLGWPSMGNSTNPNGGMTGLGQGFQVQQNQMNTQAVPPKVLESSQEFENTLKNYINIFK